MKVYMLQNEEGKWYRKKSWCFNQWVDNPQFASIWANKNGPSGARGLLTKQHYKGSKPKTEIIEFDVDVSSGVPAGPDASAP